MTIHLDRGEKLKRWIIKNMIFPRYRGVKVGMVKCQYFQFCQ